MNIRLVGILVGLVVGGLIGAYIDSTTNPFISEQTFQDLAARKDLQGWILERISRMPFTFAGAIVGGGAGSGLTKKR